MKSDFINIYAGISDKSQKEFKQYLYCFYGNQKQILTTFEEVEAVVATQDEKALLAFRKMTQVKKDEKEHKNKKAKNDYVDLKKWLFEYLALQEIRSGNIEGKFLSLEALRKHKKFDSIEQISKQLEREIDSSSSQNLWDLLLKMRISYLNYNHIPIDRLQNYQTELLEMMKNLDDFYISAKLQFSAACYNRSSVLQDEYDIILLDRILDLLKVSNHHSSHIDLVSKPILDLVKDHSRLAFDNLKAFLISHPQHYIFERQNILLCLLNYITARFRKNDYSMLNDSFELYQLGINQSLFTATGYFLSNTFINIVNTACHLKEYEWVSNFVDTQSNELDPNEKSDIVALSRARIAFDREEYNLVYELLKNLNPKNFNINLNVRTLLLRAFFEDGFPKTTMEAANNVLYKYVNKNKSINIPLRNNVLLFVKMYRSLLSKKSKNQLLKELSSMPSSMICYDWFKKKIDAR